MGGQLLWLSVIMVTILRLGTLKSVSVEYVWGHPQIIHEISGQRLVYINCGKQIPSVYG